MTLKLVNKEEYAQLSRDKDFYKTRYETQQADEKAWKKSVLKEHETKVRSFEDSIEDTARAHKKQVNKLSDERDILKEKVEVLEEVVEKTKDLRRRELAVEEQENLVAAKKDSMDTYKAEVKTLKEEAEEKAATEYKKGYADGISDGVREGLDGAKEANSNLANIAMMSAASHTPVAAEAIAKGMQNVLPATTRTKNK